MQWSDEGLVIGCRPHGEASVILELMTRGRGRHLGLVRGGRSRRLRAVLQPGNGVTATWRARLDEQLGTYAVEAEQLRAGRLIASPLALYGLATLAAHLRLLPERDPHPELFEAATLLADRLDDRDTAPALFVRFELMLLAELGFGLDLSACAATGARAGLAYVSPRTGRAVGLEAGAPYRDRLLRLPAFLGEDDVAPPARADVAAGFRLTGHFLARHVYEPRNSLAPDERGRLVVLATAADGPEADKVAAAPRDAD